MSLGIGLGIFVVLMLSGLAVWGLYKVFSIPLEIHDKNQKRKFAIEELELNNHKGGFSSK